MLRMTALAVVLLLPVLHAHGSPGAKAVEAFCPIVAVKPAPNEDYRNGELAGYLLGGWSGKGWIEDKAAASLLRGGETYRFYSLNGEAGAGAGGAPHSFADKGDPCDDTVAVSFASAPKTGEALVAIAGPFNALPRAPRTQNTDQQAYKEALAVILKEKGIARPEVRLTQVVRVDLDGDGTEEVLAGATHYAKGLGPAATPGDYSLVFLRRIEKGAVATHILEGDFFPKGLKFGAPGEHRLAAVLDLNGDGVMEIVLFGRYYEGDWVAAYRLDGDKIVKIFSAGCGL